MTPRLTSATLVSALVRRVAAEGGNAAVLAKGDPSAGAVLLICAEKGVVSSVLERLLGIDGGYRWQPVGNSESGYGDYLDRRRSRDPDLWLVELDIANAERFAAETTGDA